MPSMPPTAIAMMIIVDGASLFCSPRLISPTAPVDGAVVGGDGGSTSDGVDAEAARTAVVAAEKVAVALSSRDAASSLLVALPDDTAALMLLCRPA